MKKTIILFFISAALSCRLSATASIPGMPLHTNANTRFFKDILKSKPEWVADAPRFTQWAQNCFGPSINFYYSPPYISHACFMTCMQAAQHSYQAMLGNTINDIVATRTGYIQKIILPPGSEIIFFGDLHGSIHALIRTLLHLIAQGYCDEELRIIRSHVYFVFLGDMVDYGRDGLETLFTVLDLKAKNPHRVLICRGNHEDRIMNASGHGGFKNEIETKFPGEADELLNAIYAMYEFFPLAIFIEIANKPEAGVIQCCHGGFDEDATALVQELCAAPGPAYLSLEPSSVRPATFSHFSWADFNGSTFTADREPSQRGGSCITYSMNGAQIVMEDLNIRALFRGHQDNFDCIKFLIRGIHSPIYPFSQFPQHKQALSLISPEDKAKVQHTFKSYEHLCRYGFELGSLPTDGYQWVVAPIFTVSNASAARLLDTEGYCKLLVGYSWEASIVQPQIFSTPLMSMRSTLHSTTGSESLLGLLPGFQSTQPQWALIGDFEIALQALSLLPHFTRMGPTGLTIHPQGILDGVDFEELFIQHNFSGQHTEPVKIFHQLLAHYGTQPIP